MLRRGRKHFALLLVLAMLATMFIGVGTAGAKSVNSTNRVIAIADDFDSASLGAPVGSTVTIKEDSDFKTDFVAGDTFKVSLPSGVKWVTAQTTINFNGVPAVLDTDYFKRTDQVIEITLPAGAATAAQDVISIIPGIEVTSATGDIDLTIDPIDSAVTAGSVVFATVTSGSTSVSVDSVKKVGKNATGGVIEVKENAVAAIGTAAGNTLTLKLPSNFEWNGMGAADISMAGGFGACPAAAVAGNGTRTLTVTFSTVGAAGQRGIIYITPKFKATNDATKGEVSISISGTNAAGSDIADADIVVAEYVDYGTTASIKEVKELKAGKFAVKTAKITIEETIQGALLSNRDINIELPEWVKITDIKNFAATNGGAAFNATAAPAIKGTKNYVDITIAGTSTTKGKIEFALELSIEADKAGSIEAVISGAGATEQTLEIAKAIAPASLTTTAKDVKVGVQEQAVSDIVITEGVKEAIARQTYISGAAKNDGILTLSLTEGVQFSSEPTVTVTKGNLEIEANGVELNDDKDVLTIPIKSEGTNITEITVSNVKVTLDRTIPEGPIYVKLGGSAIAENPKAALAGGTPFLGTGNAGTVDEGEFDVATVDKEAFATVVTPAPDKTVYNTSSFVIGASKYTLNGVEVDAVAPSYAANNRTYLAIRDVAHALGIIDSNILWDGANSTVTLMKGDKVVQLKLGSNIMLINGASVTMDVAVEASNGRTFLPAAFVAQGFGATATYDAATNTVTIK